MFRIISYNIRYNNPADGSNAWPHRQESVAALLRRHQPDLFGLQEVLHEQLTALATALPDYGWLGVGRDDGVQAGEYAPIFYRRDRFTLQESGHFWLSATPEQVGTFGWDAACVRIATWAILLDETTQQTLFHLNTHFDHRGELAREESARLLVERLGSKAAESPVILTGDFNCEPTHEPYRIITAKGSGLADALFLSKMPHHGPLSTWSGFQFPGLPGRRIDYIFINDKVKVRKHAILSDSWSGRFPSDHLPVLAEVGLE